MSRRCEIVAPRFGAAGADRSDLLFCALDVHELRFPFALPEEACHSSYGAVTFAHPPSTGKRFRRLRPNAHTRAQH